MGQDGGEERGHDRGKQNKIRGGKFVEKMKMKDEEQEKVGQNFTHKGLSRKNRGIGEDPMGQIQNETGERPEGENGVIILGGQG